jgi:hypothetical protein
MQVATTKQFGNMEIQVYENPQVGHSRAQDDFWMTREQIGAALEYENPNDALALIHRRNKDRLDPLSSTFNLKVEVGNHTQMRQIYIYSLRGVMEICRYSKQPKANAFIDFCWDVITALMRGETVSLKANQAELKRQERFDQMTQALTEIHSKMGALEAARQQDRNVLDNVLFVCKQLERKLNSTGQPPKQPEQTTTTTTTDAKEIQSTTYKGRSEWRTEIYKLGKSIARMTGLPLNAVLKQAYDYIGRNYGWYFKDERKAYVERVGYNGDIKNLSGLDIIEDSETWKSIFMSIMKDRYENEKHDAEVRKGIKSALTKKPPMIPADMIPTRHRVEPAPEVVAEESVPVVVAEAHAVEIETPAIETPAVKEKKKKYYYYKPSITLPIVEPIAKKLGDKTIGYWVTYAKIYDTIGTVKMDRMRKAYVRSHNKSPKSTPDIFQNSDKNMKVFKEAAKIVAAAI